MNIIYVLTIFVLSFFIILIPFYISKKGKRISKHMQDNFAWIDYNDRNRKVILNIYGKRYFIRKLNWGSEPHGLFKFIYKHEGKDFLKSELPFTLTQHPSDVIGKIGFDKELRSLFFDSAKDSIKFTNFITNREKNRMGVDEPALKKQLEKFEMIS